MVEQKKMTVEEFDQQEKFILDDNRYTVELKRWAIMQLLDTFHDINGCFPYEKRELTYAKD
jgi:hypothetical protein